MKKWCLALILLVSATFFSGCSILSWNAKAGLQVITSDNVPAHVYLDGKLIDKTPFINRELKANEYTLEIKPDDSQLAPYETKVSLKKGLLTVVTWKLGKRPETSGGVIYEMEKLTDNKNSELSLTTIPDGAIVQVDGKAQGFSPVLLEHLSAGEHEYEVSLPSYEVQKNTINVVQGFRMNITLKLAKQEYLPPANSPDEIVPTATPSAQTSVLPGTIASSSSDLNPSVPKPKIRIKLTGYFENGKEALHVRNDPTPESMSPGLAYVGSEYPYLNQLMDGWYKISFNGKIGWVSGQFVELIQ